MPSGKIKYAKRDLRKKKKMLKAKILQILILSWLPI